MEKLAPSPLDPLAAAVANRLHAQSKKQIIANVPGLARRMAVSLLRERTIDFTQGEAGKEFVADKLVAIAPAKAALIHMLCRSIGAMRIVEAGTSFGVSTIYLAAAVRDNLAEGGEGVVIGTEHEPGKVQRALRNLREASRSTSRSARATCGRPSSTWPAPSTSCSWTSGRRWRSRRCAW